MKVCHYVVISVFMCDVIILVYCSHNIQKDTTRCAFGTNVRTVIFVFCVTYAGHYHSLHIHILRWRLECGYAYTHVSCAKNCHDIVPRILTYIHIYTSVNVYMCIHLYIYILYIHVNIRISWQLCGNRHWVGDGYICVHISVHIFYAYMYTFIFFEN